MKKLLVTSNAPLGRASLRVQLLVCVGVAPADHPGTTQLKLSSNQPTSRGRAGVYSIPALNSSRWYLLDAMSWTHLFPISVSAESSSISSQGWDFAFAIAALSFSVSSRSSSHQYIANYFDSSSTTSTSSWSFVFRPSRMAVAVFQSSASFILSM